MQSAHAVGIDLGTTYSCIAFLNEHGEPVTIPNRDGELSTPSAVLIEAGEVIVGREALRNSIRAPERVIMSAKRHMSEPDKVWKIGGRRWTPVDVSAAILRSLLDDAEEHVGTVDTAVITVPAQFGDLEREATIEAGRRAGLKSINVINEPVAAALCLVLGKEGIWFTELATSQQILVFDLGGGTLDLSLVRYEADSVRVIASGGDLRLGGIDWNDALEKAIARQFRRDYHENPFNDPESRQALALEIEQAKRSLSVRPRASVTCQHAGHRKSYQILEPQFRRVAESLVERAKALTLGLLHDNNMGWAHVDTLLTTGGSSRMPMIRDMLQQISGTTLNTALSPDLSIAHGATYYAGMLLSNTEFARDLLSEAAAKRLGNFRQVSVTARALGILVRDPEKLERFPHYLIPRNTPLPHEVHHTYGTVTPNQQRVRLKLVESSAQDPKAFVEIGRCEISSLPPDLPEGSLIRVTLRYDENGRVQIRAEEVAGGAMAEVEIHRPELLQRKAYVEGAAPDPAPAAQAFSAEGAASPSGPAVAVADPPSSASQGPPSSGEISLDFQDEENEDDSLLIPIPLCDRCLEPLNETGRCSRCDGP